MTASSTVGAVCELVIDCPHSTPEWTEDGILVFRNHNIRRGKLDLSKPSFTTEAEYAKRVARAAPSPGDIIITREAPMGEVALIPEGVRGCLGQRMVLLRPNNTRVDKRFLTYALISLPVQNEIRVRGGTGSTVSNLRIPSLKSLPFRYPELSEQRAIATALSDVDALLDALERLIAKKRDIKQAAMQQLLTGQTRLPCFHGKWLTKTLGAVATIRDGTHQTPKYVPSGIPFYSVEHVTSGDFTNTKFISEIEHRLLTKSFKIERGDVLMTRIGSIGDCKLVDWEVEASFYVSLALLKIHKGYSAAFISHYSKSSRFQKEVDLHSLQSAIPKKINLGPISNIRIDFPSLPEQSAIAEVLSEMDAELLALEARRKKTQDLKQGMMQELLTGRTRLIPPKDENA